MRSTQMVNETRLEKAKAEMVAAQARFVEAVAAEKKVAEQMKEAEDYFARHSASYLQIWRGTIREKLSVDLAEEDDKEAKVALPNAQEMVLDTLYIDGFINDQQTAIKALGDFATVTIGAKKREKAVLSHTQVLDDMQEELKQQEKVVKCSLATVVYLKTTHATCVDEIKAAQLAVAQATADYAVAKGPDRNTLFTAEKSKKANTVHRNNHLKIPGAATALNKSKLFTAPTSRKTVWADRRSNEEIMFDKLWNDHGAEKGVDKIAHIYFSGSCSEENLKLGKTFMQLYVQRGCEEQVRTALSRYNVAYDSVIPSSRTAPTPR